MRPAWRNRGGAWTAPPSRLFSRTERVNGSCHSQKCTQGESRSRSTRGAIPPGNARDSLVARLRAASIVERTADAARVGEPHFRQENDIEVLTRIENRRKYRADLAGEARFIHAVRSQSENDDCLPVDRRAGEKGLGDAWVMVEQLCELFLQLPLDRTVLLADERDVLRLALGGRACRRILTPPCQPREHATSAVHAPRESGFARYRQSATDQ